MMLNICNELPDMYIMMAFMGSCFAGAMASSQDFLIFRVSVSAVVGGLRAVMGLDDWRWRHVSTDGFETEGKVDF